MAEGYKFLVERMEGGRGIWMPDSIIVAMRNAWIEYINTTPLKELVRVCRDDDWSGYTVMELGVFIGSMSVREVTPNDREWEFMIRSELVKEVIEEFSEICPLEYLHEYREEAEAYAAVCDEISMLKELEQEIK